MRPLLAESSFEEMSMLLPAPTTRRLIGTSEAWATMFDSGATIISIHAEMIDRRMVIGSDSG